MSQLARTTFAALFGVAFIVAGSAPAAAAPEGDFFVVETQLREAPSPIVDTGGAFAGCTSVTDINGIEEQLGPHRVSFIGDKLVSCDGGEVTIHHNATLNLASGKKTSGHWFVVESALPGVQAGQLERQRRYLR